jgi:GT2 family glycosyltransferase
MESNTATKNKYLAEKQQLSAFSIVIPSHNRKEQLSRALGHVASLNYPAEFLEVVVMLDGCTDGSAQMLQELALTFPFKLSWVEQKQGGPSSARNAGVLKAANEYILFLDDDVMCTPSLVQEHYQSHLTHPDTVVVGTMSKPEDSRGPVWVRWEEALLERQYKEIIRGKYKFTARQFYTGNCSLKREWIIKAGMFDETFKRYEDVELAYRLAQLKLSFEFNPAAIGYHYPKRSFKSWVNMHYLYGRYAVKIDRDKGSLDMINISKEEFQDRNKITQLLAKLLLNHKTLQTIFVYTFMRLAQLAGLLRQDRLASQLLSSVANVLFWQGFNDELNYHSKATPNFF